MVSVNSVVNQSDVYGVRLGQERKHAPDVLNAAEPHVAVIHVISFDLGFRLRQVVDAKLDIWSEGAQSLLKTVDILKDTVTVLRGLTGILAISNIDHE